ncbi:WD repeat-containing protein 44 [Tritrichomonas musculus]|uniref:WD repeat-containing protein 44 n=1 Tax=Tritrichomonas musculus TaxID=1915356 RepID=A0ABR2KXD7_9EUKA
MTDEEKSNEENSQQAASTAPQNLNTIPIPPEVSFSTFIKHKNSTTFKKPKIASVFKPHVGSIWCLASSPDGKYISSGGEDKQVLIFEPIEERPYLRLVATFSGHENDIVHLSWSDDNLLISSSLDSTVRLWHPTQPKSLGVFQHEDAVTSSVFKPGDSKIFIACTFGLSAYVWNIETNSILSTINFNSPPTSAVFSPDGTRIVIGCFNGFCFFYNSSDFSYNTQFISGPRNKKLTAGKKITCVLFVNEDQFLVATNDSRIRLYSIQNYSVVRKYLGHVSSEAQMKISLSPDHQYIMGTSETKGSVFIWPVDHENCFSKGGAGSKFKRDRSKTYEGFALGKKITVSSAIFTKFTNGDHLQMILSDSEGRIYTVISQP